MTKLSNQGRIGSRWVRWVAGALPFTLVACGQGPGGAPAEVEATRTSAALTVSAGPTPPKQKAAGAELFVQAPFDWDDGSFDLNYIDDINADPVFSQRMAIPYDTAEAELKAKLDELTKEPLLADEYELDDGSHVLWSVTLSASARFSQRGQPRLSPWGSAANNGVHVDLDTQVEVNLNAHVHIHATAPWIIDPDDVDIPMHGLIGAHGKVNLAFFPVIKADGLEAWATLDQGDVDIVGLDGTAIGVGAVLGAGIGYVTGTSILTSSILGAITGEVALQVAKEKAKDIILKQATQAFAASHDKLTALVNKAVQPKIQGANDVLARLRSMPLPGVGTTLGEMEDELGMSLDIRSVTRDNMFRTAFTARFSNVPAGGVMSGRLRFPKRRCEYAKGGERLVGTFLMPHDVVDANQDMAATGCQAPAVAALIHRAFYGASPERVLASGVAANDLPTWASLGDVSMGEMQETGDSYDCAFTVTGLPRAAFMEAGAERGSALASALSNRQLGEGQDPQLEVALHGGERLSGRFVMLEQAGVSVVLNHDGTNLASLDFGGKAPTTPQDCPFIVLASGGGAPQYKPGDEIPNDGSCPQCGGEMLPPGADAENPAAEQLGDPDAPAAAIGVENASDPAAMIGAENALDPAAAIGVENASDPGAVAASSDPGASVVAPPSASTPGTTSDQGRASATIGAARTQTVFGAASASASVSAAATVKAAASSLRLMQR